MDKTKPFTAEDEQLARYAKALAHPARVFILRFLERSEQCYASTIFDELPMAQSTVSQHLKELKEAGLIQGEIEPPKVRYCINRPAWQQAKALMLGLLDSSSTIDAGACGC